MQIALIAATTIDGFIGKTPDDRSFDWTSPEDKQFYIDQIKKADVIIMGRQTFESIHRYPKNSRWIIYTSQPESFVAPQSEVATFESTNEDPQKLVKRLENEGVHSIMICGGSSLYSLFMKAGLIIKMYLTIEPVVFGSGVPLFNTDLGEKQTKLTHVEKLSSQTILLEYDVL